MRITRMDGLDPGTLVHGSDALGGSRDDAASFKG